MEKILITGIAGFVGRHFLDFLYDNNIMWEVCGVDINTPQYNLEKYSDKISVRFKVTDLLDKEKIENIVYGFKPDYLLHLASFSSVAYSWKHPAECFENNTQIFLNIMEAIMKYSSACRVLSIGSSEEYGNCDKSTVPLKEDMALNPISPYAAARLSQELISKIFVESYGMNVVMTRSFNHIGPYQDSRFVIPSFIERIFKIKENGCKEGTIETGDITIIRDFVDVRDVVKAYYELLLNGRCGEIYNICSGKGITLKEIVDMIAELCDVKVGCRINQEYVRPNDNRIIIGSFEKIENHVGWKPEIELRKTLKDMISERMEHIEI